MSVISTSDETSSSVSTLTDTEKAEDDTTTVDIVTDAAVTTLQVTEAATVAAAPVTVERRRCREKVAADAAEILPDVNKTSDMISPNTKVAFIPLESKGLFPLRLRCAALCVASDSERHVAMSRYTCSATSLHIVHYRSLSLATRSAAQRSRSGNRSLALWTTNRCYRLGTSSRRSAKTYLLLFSF